MEHDKPRDISLMDIGEAKQHTPITTLYRRMPFSNPL